VNVSTLKSNSTQQKAQREGWAEGVRLGWLMGLEPNREAPLGFPPLPFTMKSTS
jgi:hypothetical protein